MSLDNEDQYLLDQPTNHEMHQIRNLKFSYSREFLLSLSELDTCKELPSGFDRSVLSEFEDAHIDRQRSTGGLSTSSLRLNEHSSSPPTRGDTRSFLWGTNGKWDFRSSGRSDKDSDSQSERESDSGKHLSNQSRMSWQGPEHDGLLGSGSFPRPSGYEPGLSALKFRANGNYQQCRANEPYQRSGPYKAPHSCRDTHDNYNDETFGSSAEFADDDREDEERKRRASFELMRKEQQKAFQEKQKLNQGKNKDAFDISSLLDDNDKRLVKRSNESAEPPVILSALSDDSEKFSVANITSTSRPLVPPGFASTLLERNLGLKTSTNNHAIEVGQPEPGVTSGNCIFYENTEGKLSTKQADDDQLHHRSTNLNVPIKNEKENILNISPAVDIQDINVGNSDQMWKQSTLSETLETSHTSEFIQFNAEVKRTEAIGAFCQDDSHSELNKLFVNALSLKCGNTTGVVEHDDTADETWSPHAFQSSKFAHWFVEEEKKALDDFTHRPNDLLSLIVGGEKGGLVSDLEKSRHVAPASPFQNAEPVYDLLTSNVVHAPIDNSEQLYKSDKPELVPAILTCEDLEQSILSRVNENGLSLQQPMQDKDSYIKTEQSNSNNDNHASQHLLSLLQLRTCHKDIEQSSILDVDFADKVCNTEGAATANIYDDPGEANADVSDSSKQLTLETLFGTAFMTELQSVGAPLSVQRGSVESAGPDVSDSILSLFPASGNGLPHAGGHALNRHGSGILPSEKTHPPKPNRYGEQWLEYGDPQGDVNSLQLQSKFAKASGFDGPNDICLPEEDSLIAVGDPLQNFLSAGNSAKTGLSQDIAVDITGKLAALNPVFRVEQPVMGNQEGIAYSRSPYDMREPGIPYQNLNVQRSSRLQPLQLNHMGPVFNQLDFHPSHISPYMKQMTPEGMVHRESPPNHQYPGNMHLPSFDQRSNALTEFDPPAHHSLLQQMHMQGNLPPPHLLRGFPGGVPPPAHPSNAMTGFIQEPNPMQGFPFSGHRQSPFGGPGMPLQASDVAGGRNHPETLQMLLEMELRSRARPGF